MKIINNKYYRNFVLKLERQEGSDDRLNIILHLMFLQTTYNVQSCSKIFPKKI